MRTLILPVGSFASIAGIPDIVGMCNAILLEEQKMAAWLEKNLPQVVNDYLGEMA